ncbi:MAG: beta galactosidase jelly roll domain-containing protein [Bacteroidetes bacterium]|nr:beta galactosidase jelly roll domain-containing protein [Bacteroidota bacterium]
MCRLKQTIIKYFLLLFLGSTVLRAQEFLDHRASFQLTQWKFLKGDIYSGEEGGPIDTTGWRDVTVPNTYNGTDVLTKGPRYYQGVTWYRTTFVINKEPDKRYFVRFQGVCLVADVFFNGVYLGTHKGAYAAFIYEITPYIRTGKENYLCVRVDNAIRMDVAPAGTYLFPLFGGITRPVTVFTTSDLCISPLDYASSGVYIHPVSVSNKNAEVNAEVLLNYAPNDSSTTRSTEAILSTTVTDSEGNRVFKAQKNVSIKGYSTIHLFQRIDIKNPHLWNARQDPYMYTLRVSLVNSYGKELDEVDQPLGLRYFRVSHDSGLILDGKPYDLYGVIS